jgi:hypothetical protein
VWLLGVAYGFRFVEFVIGGALLRAGGWQDLLRVDILNIIALGLAASALLTAGRPRAGGVLLAASAALFVVVTTPIVADVLRHYDLPRTGQPMDPGARAASSRLADVLLAYLYGSYPRANFSLFNWSAFLLAGAALGPLAIARSRPWAWLGVGVGLLGLGWVIHREGPDIFAYQNFWRTSPAWFAMRLGVCVGVTGLLQLVPNGAVPALRWLSTLGRQSLVAYIASVELTYGILAYPVRRSLALWSTLVGMVAMVAITWAVAAAWERLQASRRDRAVGAAAPKPGA